MRSSVQLQDSQRHTLRYPTDNVDDKPGNLRANNKLGELTGFALVGYLGGADGGEDIWIVNGELFDGVAGESEAGNTIREGEIVRAGRER